VLRPLCGVRQAIGLSSDDELTPARSWPTCKSRGREPSTAFKSSVQPTQIISLERWVERSNQHKAARRSYSLLILSPAMIDRLTLP
jgi:hypothetical protein